MKRKVWSEFEYTKKNGKVLKFTVLDCPDGRFDDAIELYQKYFVMDESIQKLSGVPKSKEAIEECTIIFGEMLKEEGMHIAICIENSTDTIVGVSCMELSEAPYVPDITPQTKEVAKLFEIIGGMGRMYNVPSNYSVDKFYDGRGMVVHPDYRGFGVGRALVESRKNISRDHGVSVTSAWMTSLGTQKAAERDGWETPFEIKSHEFARRFDVLPYVGIASTLKVMVKRVL